MKIRENQKNTSENSYFLKNNNEYEINLIFNNNAYISLKSETIEVRLEDQNEIK